MSFFKQFPTFNYFLADRVKTVTDIFRHVDVNDVLAADITNYKFEMIGDGERPDNLSQRLYGTPDYYWTFFIVNESLKNGLDDWPVATAAMEKEFQREYDNMAALTFKPYIADDFITAIDIEDEVTGLPAAVPLKNIRDTFAGLDLSYEDLKVFRNFETASIVKWDNTRQQLFLKDFTNRSRFMADPLSQNVNDRLTSIDIDVPPSIERDFATTTNWDFSSFRGQLTFTFNDWPIIGKNDGTTSTGENGLNFDYIATMTPQRTEWMVHLFEWFESNLVDTNIDSIQTPLSLFNSKLAENITRAEAAFHVFRRYFSYLQPAGYLRGLSRFVGFIPYRRVADNNEHTFTSARNAPFCYYADSNYSEDNKVTAYDALTNPEYNIQNYKSYYQEHLDQHFKQSRIKVVRPDVVAQFAQAYAQKLNAGVTVVGNSEGIVASDSVSAASSVGFGGGGTASNVSGTTGNVGTNTSSGTSY